MPEIIADHPISFWTTRGHRGGHVKNLNAGPKVACPECGNEVSECRLQYHKKFCKGPKVTGVVPAAHRLHHDFCQCGRKKTRLAPCCFRCSGVDLDAIVMAGREKGK